jgi:hypothetical protein
VPAGDRVPPVVRQPAQKLLERGDCGLVGFVERQHEFQILNMQFVRDSHGLGDKSKVESLVAVNRPLFQGLEVMASRHMSQKGSHSMGLFIGNA